MTPDFTSNDKTMVIECFNKITSNVMQFLKEDKYSCDTNIEMNYEDFQGLLDDIFNIGIDTGFRAGFNFKSSILDANEFVNFGLVDVRKRMAGKYRLKV